jgi:hypothetical protein
MALLESYFNRLQSHTGADCFVIVRDDASNASSRSEEFASPESDGEVKTPGSPLQRKSVKREPKFQPENIDHNPPCPPKRMDSRDDLAMCRSGFKPTRNQQPSKQSSRLNSLFGAEMASRIASSRRQAKPEHKKVEMEALSNLAAPKFPMRKGSCDDLSTLPSSRIPSSRRRMSDLSNTGGFSNEKLDLSVFMDEVISVIEGTKTRQIIRTGSS